MVRSLIAAAALLLASCAEEPPRESSKPTAGINAPEAEPSQCLRTCDDELDTCLEREQGTSQPCGLACTQRCEMFYDACQDDCG